MSENNLLTEQLQGLVLRNIPEISRIKPSDWVEENIVMGKPFPGPFRYRRTPYTREIIDILSPDNPCWGCAVKKGGQIGFSSGVVYPGICWIIKNNPGNTSLSVGAPELIKKATDKLDASINSAGLRDYIKPSSLRKRNNKSGDTNTQKDFTGGYAMIWSANNHKNIRQVDLQTQFNDDFVAIKKASKESGSTDKKLDQRSAAYADTKKRMDISTPELVGSTIDEAYERGDKRRFLIPCPCCKDLITIDWQIKSVIIPDKTVGITWSLKENGQLDKESVGYICPLCDGFFNDKDKMDWLNKGEWVSFAIPKVENYRSYHISALYAPIGMDGWDKYVQDYIEINPPGIQRNETMWQWFVNEVLGESYEQPTEAPKATDLMKKCRSYTVGVVPEAVSEADGNGDILLLIATFDCNGTQNDARIDGQLKAISREGATYSVVKRSFGTFIPNQSQEQKARDTREKWTYERDRPNSVWKLVDEFLDTIWKTDTGRMMKIAISGMDVGNDYKNTVYNYLDKSKFSIFALMGDKENDLVRYQENIPVFKQATSRHDLYMVNVNAIKDEVANRMKLPWDMKHDTSQPHEFMNFPQYDYDGFFSHYESESRRENEKGYFGWQKKSPTAQNHFWDCFDDKTEVLTTDGWKYFKEIEYFDSLATVCLETNNLEYHHPLHLIKKEYSGHAISIETDKVSCLVTENHRMVVYRKKWNTKTKSGRMLDVPQVILAKDLRLTDTIKTTCSWNVTGNDFFIIPELKNKHGRVIAVEKKIPSEVWASFIGIYAAEGCKAKNKKGTSIRHLVKVFQNEGVKFDKIKEVFDQLPFKHHVLKRKNKLGRTFVICQKQLYLAIEPLGNLSQNKRSGEWIKNQSSSVIKKFIDFAILGDGYANKDHGHRKYYTTSEGLSNDIQELIIKTGFQPSMHEVFPKPCLLHGNQNGISKKQYHISENVVKNASIRKSNNTPLYKTVEYDGMVYCATVPNGTLVVRRNGKAFIAGNCEVYFHATKEIYLWKLFRKGLKEEVFTWKHYASKCPVRAR